MLTVLLIDDEDLELEGLEAMIMGMDIGCEICGKARNAQQGIAMALEKKPDVILSDVKMPKMDGIEMSKKIRQLGIDTFLVFISGYQDFEAAQQAIALGAKSYLLKPVNCGSLKEVLLRAGEDRKKNEREEQRKKDVDGSLRRLAHHDKNVFLKKLFLKKNIQEEEIIAEMRSMGLPVRKGKYAVSLLHGYHESGEGRYLESEIPDSLLEIAEKHGLFPPAVLPTGEIGFLFVFPGFASEEEITEQLMTVGEKLLSEAVSAIYTEINLGISGTTEQLSEIPELMRQAKTAIGQAFYSGYGKIFLYEGEMVKMDKLVSRSSEIVKELVAAIAEGDSEKYSDTLKKLFEQWDYFTPTESVRGTCIEIISLVWQLCKDAGMTENETGAGVSAYYERLLKQNTIKETFLYMREYGEQMCSVFSSKRQKQGNQLVIQIQEIVEKECDKMLSIDDIAERVYMSASHISRVFKNHTGETILNYLQSVKMRKALEYLEMPQYHIHEIGAMVGYDNPSYFTMVFKKYYGVTPGKYRENMGLFK